MNREEIADWLSGFEGEVEPPAAVTGLLEELASAHANPEADWASFAAACALDIAVIANRHGDERHGVALILQYIGWMASFLEGHDVRQDEALTKIHQAAHPWVQQALSEADRANLDAATSTHH